MRLYSLGVFLAIFKSQVNAADCTAANVRLRTKDDWKDITFDYTEATAPTWIDAPVYTETYKEGCQITSCAFRDAAAASGAHSPYIKLFQVGWDWYLFYSSNVPEGYTATLGVQCTNADGGDTPEAPAITFLQNSQCGKQLSAPTAQTFSYDKDKATQTNKDSLTLAVKDGAPAACAVSDKICKSLKADKTTEAYGNLDNFPLVNMPTTDKKGSKQKVIFQCEYPLITGKSYLVETEAAEITLTPLCKDVSKYVAKGTTALTQTYAYGAASVVIKLSDYFTLPDQTDCPSVCTIQGLGKDQKYHIIPEKDWPNQPFTGVKGGSADSIALTFKFDNKKEMVFDGKFTCESQDDATIQSSTKSFKITQTKICLDSLKAQTKQLKQDGTGTYDSTSEWKAIQFTETLTNTFGFDISDTTNCGAITCNIASGTEGTYTAGNVKASNDIKLAMKVNVKDGYKDTVTIKCEDNEQNIAFTNAFTVEQIGVCKAKTMLSKGEKPATTEYEKAYQAGTEFEFNQITTADPTNCGITTMKVVDSVKDEPATDTNIKITLNGEDDKWYITADSSIVLGYTESFRIEVKTALETLYSDVFKVTYDSKCKTLMTLDISKIKDVTRKYDASKKTLDQVTEFGFPITGYDDRDCKVSCMLQDEKGAEISSTEVTFRDGDLYMVQNFKGIDGYSVTISNIVCTTENDLQKLETKKPFTLSQTSNCLSSLSLSKNMINVKKAYLDSALTTAIPHNILSSDTTNCPITYCEIKNKDDSLYDGENIKVSGTKVTAVQNFIKGYSEEIKIQCFNKGDSDSFETNFITVEQTTKCAKVLELTQPKNQNFKWSNDKSDTIDIAHGLTSSDAQNCPVTKCELIKTTTEDSYTNKNVVVDDSKAQPLNIKLSRDEIYGYDIAFRVKCYTGAETMITGIIKAEQETSCAQMLKTKKIDDVTWDYVKSDGTNEKYDKEWIQSDDNTNCPVQSCEIQVSDGSKFTELQYAKLSPSEAKDGNKYVLNMIKSYNELGGYTNNFKIECKNQGMTLATNLFKVKQNANPCLTSMSLVEESPAPLELSFSETEFYLMSQTKWEDQFITIDKCPVTSCELKGKDCKGVATTALVLKSDNGYVLQARNNAAEGYNTEACILCDNGDQILSKNYKVSQTRRCLNRLTNKVLTETDKEMVVRYKPVEKNVFGAHVPKMIKSEGDLFDRFFKNDNHDSQCPVLDCYAEEAGCTGKTLKLPNSAIQKSGGLLEMWAHDHQIYGYIDKFCLVCANGDRQTPRDTIKQDGVSVNLPSKCTYSMRSSGASGTYAFDHDDSGLRTELIANPFKEFFVQDDITNCPVTSCMLLDQNCKTAHGSMNVKMEKTSPYKITMGDSIIDGYADQSCVVCSNEYQKIYQQVSITQNARCAQKLTTKLFTVPNLPLEYSDKDQNTQISQGWTDFFKNTDTGGECAVSSCSLKQADCKTAWDTVNKPGIDMQKTAPFKIEASQNIILGIKDETACVVCKNKHQTISNTFKVQQFSKCLATLEKLPVMLAEGEKDTKEDGTKKINKFRFEFGFNSVDNMMIVAPTGPLKKFIDGLKTDDVMTDDAETEKDSETKEDSETKTDDAETEEDGETNEDETKNENRRLEGEKTTYPVFDLFFKNKDFKNCRQTSCQLMSPGCLYGFSSNKYVRMQKSYPWAVEIDVNVVDGWQTELCVRCSNGWQTVEQDNIVLVQNPQVPWTVVLIVVGVIVILLVGGIGFLTGTKMGSSKQVKSAPGSVELGNRGQEDQVRQTSVYTKKTPAQPEPTSGADTGRALASGGETARTQQ